MAGAVVLLCALLGQVAPAPVVGPSALDEALAATVADGLILQSDVDWHRGDYGRAARALLLDTSFDPDNVSSWVGAAWLVWSWGATPASLAILDHMIEVTGDNETALSEAASLADLQGDTERTLRWAREAYRLEPGDPLNAVRLGSVLRKREQWAEAAEVYRQLLERVPDHPSALRFLGRYERTGRMTPETPAGVESQPAPSPDAESTSRGVK